MGTSLIVSKDLAKRSAAKIMGRFATFSRTLKIQYVHSFLAGRLVALWVFWSRSKRLIIDLCQIGLQRLATLGDVGGGLAKP